MGGRAANVRFCFRPIQFRQSALVKSFGRRRRTKVSEERTRGPQATVYGDFGFLLMPAAFGPTVDRLGRDAIRAHCCWIHRPSRRR